jgi:methyl-accepting chemotaxis protein
MMLTWITQTLVPPVFEDEDKTRTAYALNIIVLTVMALAVLFSIFSLVVIPEQWSIVIPESALVLVGVGVLSLMRRGHVRLAGLLFSFVLWVIITLVTVVSGGVRTPGFSTYTAVILIAGLLLGGYFGIGFAGLSALAGLGMLYAEVNGILSEPVGANSPVSAWGTLTMSFIVAAAVLSLAIHSINRALERVRSNERDLVERNRELEVIRTSLERRNERLQTMVGQYVEYMDDVAQGNLAARLALAEGGSDADDLLVTLGHNLNKMTASLQKMTLQIRETANNLSASAAEILAATTQQASGASEQSAAIAQTTTTVDELKTIAEQSVGRAQEVAGASQRTVEISHTGRQAVQETMGSMGQIKVQVEGIAENILALSEQTQQIGEIIATVNDIAAQSNMLALNASVEAARAGEYGKGFAVVAVEVRNLAEQSRQATGQVKAILSDIQKATNATVMATEEGTKRVEAGAELAGQAGAAIEQLGSVIEESAQAAAQMVAGGRQQAAGVEQVALAMQSINQATTQSLASTRQAEKAAQDLNELAKSLLGIVEYYRL